MSNNHRSLLHNLRQRLPTTLRKITIPNTPFKDVALQRKSQLLSILLLIMIVLFVLLDLSYYITVPDYRTPISDIGGYLFLICAYLLNRSGRYNFAAVLTVLMIPVVIFSTILTNSSQNVIVTLNFLVLGLLLSSILLNIKSTIGLTLVLVFGILVFPLATPNSISSFTMIAGPLITILIGSGLTITFMIHRNQIENDRQAEIRESEERLSKFINSAENSFHILAPDFKILEINRGALEAIYSANPSINSKEDVVGQDFWQIYPFLKDERPHFTEVLLKGKKYANELTIPHPKLGDLILSFLCFKVGNNLGIIVENITERKEAEDALRTSESRATALLEAIPDMMFRLSKQGVYLDYMADAPALYTQIKETLIGHNIRDITSPEFGDLIEQKIKLTLDSGKMQTFEYKLPIAGRGQVEYEARMVKSGANEVITIVRDITENKKAEDLIRLQERMTAVGQMAAGIAHDFNNVLAVITLYSQSLHKSSNLTSKEQHQLQIIYQQAMRASELTGQILDFSRQSVMERQPVDLLLIVREFKKLLERMLPEDIKIKLDYGEGTYLINADLTRIQQVIMNLVINARDAMLDGGILSIKMKNETYRLGDSLPEKELVPGDWVKLDVTDDGSGISPDILPNLFEPFFTTKEPGKGTGLGLAQVYGIVKQHEGYIFVESQLGAGTTFSIYFPSLPVIQSQKVSHKDLNALIYGKGELVLVVEDESAVREALRDSLVLLNYQVIMATNGREAIAILEKRRDEIVLILSDVVMPEMGGLELLQALRKKNLTIPVIMLTGHLSGERLENLRAEGLKEWITKPVKIEILSQAVSRLLNENLVKL